MMTSQRPGHLRLLATAVLASAILAAALVLKGNGYQSRFGCDKTRGAERCQVLFVGNSYTYVNDLPAIFEDLAGAGHHPVRAQLVAGSDESLLGHVTSGDAMRALRSAKWNVVVLQEQSQIPASERLRKSQMYPAARQLVGMARNTGAQPMLFLTWARRYGWPANGLLGYATMQAAVDNGYLMIAHGLHVAIAPVGYAWSATLNEEQQSDRHAGLWRRDGSHPTVKGTYLAACVFYAAIFREAPVGLSYHAGLPVEEAARLQATASRVVFGDSAKWGLR